MIRYLSYINNTAVIEEKIKRALCFAVVLFGYNTNPLLPPAIIAHSLRTLQRNFYLCIPRRGITRPQSQFTHSCVCERSICSQDRSTYYTAAEKADRSKKYINRTQKHECRNWVWPRSSFSGNICCEFSVLCLFAVYQLARERRIWSLIALHQKEHGPFKVQMRQFFTKI